MAVNLTIAGQVYSFPTEGEDNWGNNVTLWATAVSTQLLQRTGGTFTLTNDVNFGASFGLISTYFKSRSSNIGTAGILRLARTDTVSWRNEANSDNNLLGVNSSNELTWNGTPLLVTPGGVLPPADGGTGISSYTAGDMIYATAATTLAKLAIGTANHVLRSTGSAPSWGLLVNANIDAAAAIDRSKLSVGTADHVVINSGTGAFSSEAQLATSRGGTGVNSTATFPTSGVVVTEAATQTLSAKTLTTPLINGVQFAVAASATGAASFLSTDYLIPCDATAGAFSLAIPAAAGNTRGVVRVIKTDATFNAVTISDGTFSTTLNTQNEAVELISNGSTYLVISRRIPSVWTAFTPTGSWITNTTYTGFWQRVGDSIVLDIAMALAGAPTSATLTIDMPTGLTIDSSKLTSVSGFKFLGEVGLSDNTAGTVVGKATYNTTSLFTIVYLDDSAAGLIVQNPVTQAAPFLFAINDAVTMRTTSLPVTGWNG